MQIHYYFSVFPLEALIASQLDPEQFGAYMATGPKRGSFEPIIFAEIHENGNGQFDWEFAKERCIPHKDGDPKHSVYLSIYRTLENLSLSQVGSLYLTTKDGRTLELKPIEYAGVENSRGYFIYQELCPVRPLVASSLDPKQFASYLTDPSVKTSVPKLIFTDLKVINFNDTVNTGHLGGVYDRNVEHLKDCVFAVTEYKDKPIKVVERSTVDRFSYQVIEHGIYIGDSEGLVMYEMKDEEELRRFHYDWGRSALIL